MKFGSGRVVGACTLAALVAGAAVAASHNDVDYTDLVNSDATSVSRRDGGYDVTFAQNIRGCAAATSVGPAGGPHGDALASGWATADTSYSDHTVHVDVFREGLNGLPVHQDPASFHLIVAC